MVKIPNPTVSAKIMVILVDGSLNIKLMIKTIPNR